MIEHLLKSERATRGASGCILKPMNVIWNWGDVLLLSSNNCPYLRQPAVLVRAVSHSRCLGLQFSSPPPAPLLPLSQPEWGTSTSSERACSAWSTISIFTESWDDRFHRVPARREGTIKKRKRNQVNSSTKGNKRERSVINIDSD